MLSLVAVALVLGTSAVSAQTAPQTKAAPCKVQCDKAKKECKKECKNDGKACCKDAKKTCKAEPKKAEKK